MKQIFVGLLIVLTVQLNAQVSIIPKPQLLQLHTGEFTLTPSTAIQTAPEVKAEEVVRFLVESVKAQTGIQLLPNAKSLPFIYLKSDASLQNDEAYRLTVTAERILIEAKTNQGFFWAVQSLRQLLPFQKTTSAKIPCQMMEDAPSFRWRGHMMDVARHFFPVSFIKKQLDLMSLYKLNIFHWHLTDDQGWRIEIKKYPKLTSVGAWRKEPDGSIHGGFYTQAEIKEVVEYARRRNITVIPEIEMPGHCVAALVAYPELACTNEKRVVPNSWGVFGDVFCVGKENVYVFLQNVLDEVMPLFPSRYVHIGGDEVPKTAWQASPECQALMKAQGLKDEHELQSYFIKRIQKYLQSKGKTLIGWDEILEGGADKDAIVEVWRGEAEGRKALANGNRIIHAGPYYFDSPNANLTLKKVYEYDNLSDPAYRQNSTQVWGAECPLWTERVTTYNAEYMLYPRMLAFSESLWNNGTRNFEEFRARVQQHYPILTALKVAYGAEDKSLIDTKIEFDAAHKSWSLRSYLGMKDLAIRYTLNGTKPTAQSPKAQEVLTVTKPGKITFAPFRGDKQYRDAQSYQIIENKAVAKKTTWNSKPDAQYAKPGEYGLVDGLKGGESFGDGVWMGWSGRPVDAVVDMGEKTTFRSVKIDFIQEAKSWILLPKSVKISASDDGIIFTTLIEKTFDVKPLLDGIVKETVGYESKQPIQKRYLKVEAIPYGKLPVGHNGAGGEAWLFTDELIVN
ncbi:family 20 glycosylhydrolase [Runella sp. CRIBMP]|uniref:glycoside hydrolase family 20 protein n=1 Tax=Runella sp. CRIBMP TaxID=2683261 RepID=UPI0014134A02|nr:family 20 glycosylhydrolase [Runella sp. CRIBMP]NBB17901.1 family 20 glycosylhydrolase [Runella sp. CRIBMP]